MTPHELQRALAQMPSRAAQTLIFRCIERRTARACAALYGIGLPQWHVLYFEAARALAGDTSLLPDDVRTCRAELLQRAAEVVPGPANTYFLLRDEDAPPPTAGEPELADAALRDPAVARWVALLKSLTDQREEVHQLMLETERVAAASPARAREGWLRRLAVVAIIAVSLFVWLRERNKAAPPAPSHFPLPPRGLG